jgi:hypothetical protein
LERNAIVNPATIGIKRLSSKNPFQVVEEKNSVIPAIQAPIKTIIIDENWNLATSI